MTRTLKAIKQEIETAREEYRAAFREFHGDVATDDEVAQIIYKADTAFGSLTEAARLMVNADVDNVKKFAGDISRARIAKIIYVLAETLVEQMTCKINEGMGLTVYSLFMLEIERNLAIHYDYVRQPNEVL